RRTERRRTTVATSRARSRTTGQPERLLAVMAVILIILYGVIAIFRPRTPRLGIDPQGGTPETLTLARHPQGTSDKMNVAVNIIRERVNAFGVSEAQVNTQGNNNITVSLPGRNQQQLLSEIGQPAVLNFRVVLLCSAPSAAPAPTTAPTPAPTS